MAVERLGYIGLGVMGSRMARNLARKSGLPVVGYDVDPAKVAALAADGIEPATSIREVIERADVVFICVPGEPQVREACLGEGGVAEYVRPGQVVVDMTTAGPGIDREVAEALGAKGVEFADAPVARASPTRRRGHSRSPSVVPRSCSSGSSPTSAAWGRRSPIAARSGPAR